MNSRIMDSRDTPSLLVSPADAERAGLADGNRAVVKSAHGSLEGVVRIVRP